ncbi:hypothetical protein [Psychroserpens ponticola]|uniref:Lipoprotein n=1 Tax=Psychroserpens ponticola TaxID=2932268 RepID=A0ABY7S2P2_9FLAO|nr:hypothetical protein [Psychroserpens ponticola]WCO03558.1 hypothetical protein MUN68_008625 [Psychroserpens ponticola]
MNLLLFLILTSCEKECKLKPIDESVFDLNKINNKYYLTSDKSEIDSITLIEKIDFYEKTSFKGPMNYRECQHVKSYIVDFQDKEIQIHLTKRENGDYELNLFSQCISSIDGFKVNPSELTNNKFVFERTSCGLGKSNIEQIILNGYKIESIKTVDKKTWKLE